MIHTLFQKQVKLPFIFQIPAQVLFLDTIIKIRCGHVTPGLDLHPTEIPWDELKSRLLFLVRFAVKKHENILKLLILIK